ncbi:MAG: beta-phosphoglucomutase family hydrolase [Candidatus Omnitrophica bacterium]|nr:beta-phosphoglucomutase family hydrolase [Candidatus Omnitrophota bacterium]
MGFKGAIFDLDGVIVHTVSLHFKAWQKMFSEYGKEFSFEDYKQKVDGIPRISGARAVLTDLSDQELMVAAARKQIYFLEFLERDGVEVYQSTIDLVKELKAQNIKVAVISSSKNCLFILKRVGVDSLFDVILTGNDVKKGKPEPDVFLLAAEKLNLTSDVCLVFEDAVLGIEAANRAKMKSIGIDRYQKPERLSKADIVCSDLSELNFQKLEGLFS